jgi:hypothetical protein
MQPYPAFVTASTSGSLDTTKKLPGSPHNRYSRQALPRIAGKQARLEPRDERNEIDHFVSLIVQLS